jgi:lipoprotein-releasing system permease protein
MPPASRPPWFPFYLHFLSFRYLRSRFSALAALLSVMFGVAVIVIALSIMGGYVDALREIIRGQEAHLLVVGPERYGVTGTARLIDIIEGVPNVAAAAPFIETQAMYRSAQYDACFLKGIVPDREPLVTDIGGSVLTPAEIDQVLARVKPEADAAATGGASSDALFVSRATREVEAILTSPARHRLGPAELEALFALPHRQQLLATRNPEVLADLDGKAPPAVLIGTRLLFERQMAIGDVIILGTMAPGTSEPVTGRFVVAGAFKSGDFEADSKWMYVGVDPLKNMLGLHDPERGSRYEGVRIKTRDLALLDRTQSELQAAIFAEFPDLHVFTWEDLPRGRNLLKAVDIEKYLIYFLLLLLILFTSVLVLLMLLLTVIEKTRDMGILLALGATPGGVIRIFLTNGFVLSAAGIALGLGAGYLFCLYINPIHDWIHARTGWRLFPPEIYRMDQIPITFRPEDVLLSIAPPIILGFIASLLPAVWASRRDPIKAIHYE